MITYQHKFETHVVCNRCKWGPGKAVFEDEDDARDWIAGNNYDEDYYPKPVNARGEEFERVEHYFHVTVNGNTYCKQCVDALIAESKTK